MMVRLLVHKFLLMSLADDGNNSHENNNIRNEQKQKSVCVDVQSSCDVLWLDSLNKQKHISNIFFFAASFSPTLSKIIYAQRIHIKLMAKWKIHFRSPKKREEKSNANKCSATVMSLSYWWTFCEPFFFHAIV